MKLLQRWLFAVIVTTAVLFIVKLETSGIIHSDVRAFVSTSKDIVMMQNAVKQTLQHNEEKIPVNASIHSKKLLDFVSVKPLQDGYLLMYEQAPIIEAFQDGYIVFTGYTKQTGKTMTVHYGHVAVTYGFLDSFNHLPYTSVLAGELLGLKGSSTPLFLKVEVNGQVLTLEALLPLLREWSVE